MSSDIRILNDDILIDQSPEGQQELSTILNNTMNNVEYLHNDAVKNNYFVNNPVGQVYFIDVNGSNEQGDGTKEKPFATLSYVFNSLSNKHYANLITIKMNKGTYNDSPDLVNFTGSLDIVSSSGIASDVVLSNAMRFRACRALADDIKVRLISLRGHVSNGCLTIAKCNGIFTLNGLVFDDTTTKSIYYCIYVIATDLVSVQSCVLNNNATTAAYTCGVLANNCRQVNLTNNVANIPKGIYVAARQNSCIYESAQTDKTKIVAATYYDELNGGRFTTATFGESKQMNKPVAGTTPTGVPLNIILNQDGTVTFVAAT